LTQTDSCLRNHSAVIPTPTFHSALDHETALVSHDSIYGELRYTNYFIPAGQKFAMLEQKSLLSTMLRNFKFTAVNAERCSEYIPDIILRPKNGIDLDISLRK
jgi:hypothetical protein